MKQNMGRQALNRGMVNLPGQVEEISWSFFDFLTYAAAGQTNLTFFQTPQGGAKTVVDTNMKLAAQIPAGQSFLVTGVSFEFQPGVNPENSSALAGVAAVNGYTNDTHAVMKSGFVQFTIGSKQYVENSPIGLFPPTYGLSGFGAAATTAAATTINEQYARISGAAYSIIPVTLQSNQNFAVNVQWPTVVALPSTVAGRLGCRLHGRLFRNAQ